MMQADIFDYIHQRFFLPKDKPVRLFESFSGIGFQRMAFEKANIPVDVVGISEIDKYALQSYQAMWGDCPNLGSITDIKGEQMPKDIDVFTYSFPCQDLSKAGKQAGLGDTRSGLIYEILRLLHEMEDNLPKVLIMENVTALYEQKFIKQWNEIQFEIEKLGYTNYAFTLNSKNFGIAHNRDRAFMVSILGEWNYVIPKPFPLTIMCKDYLELSVDASYYLSEKQIKSIQNPKYESMGIDRVNSVEGVINTITTMGGGNREPKILTPKRTEHGKAVRKEYESGKHRESRHTMTEMVPRKDGITNTITTVQKDNYLFVLAATKQGYVETHDGDGVYIDRPHQKRGVVQSGMILTLKTSSNDIGIVVKNGEQFVIRKLTPIETGRSMAMPEHLIEKQLQAVSKTQAYKQHGNGIVADVMSYIVGMMHYETQDELKVVIDEYNKQHCYAFRKEKGDL